MSATRDCAAALHIPECFPTLCTYVNEVREQSEGNCTRPRHNIYCVKFGHANDHHWGKLFFKHGLIKPIFSHKLNYRVVLAVDGVDLNSVLRAINTFSPWRASYLVTFLSRSGEMMPNNSPTLQWLGLGAKYFIVISDGKKSKCLSNFFCHPGNTRLLTKYRIDNNMRQRWEFGKEQ